MSSKNLCDQPHILYVSLAGNDRWSGRLPDPNKTATDGPLATISAAKRAVRRLQCKSSRLPESIYVVLRGGTYYIEEELVFTPEDGGWFYADRAEWPPSTKPSCSVTYCAYKNEKPIISGGRRIKNFKVQKFGDKKIWVAEIPEVKARNWSFSQLWVNGRRARRPRIPKKGYFRISQLVNETFDGDYHAGQDRFIFSEGDIQRWKNVSDIEFVALHFWIETRRKFKSIDYDKCIAELEYPSRMRLTDDYSGLGAIYYLDNVHEALSDPGEWYLDKPSGQIYYIPIDGEILDDTEVVAPVLEQLIRLQGDTLTHERVACLHFQDIAFRHNEENTSAITQRLASGDSIQAACRVPGAVALAGAEQCSFDGCEIAHLGTYAVEMTGGCIDISILRCTLKDLGAGGIKIWHGCNRNTVSDCVVADGGHVNRSGVGVLIGKASGNRVEHCHIFDFDYTGVSVGWTWSYDEGDAYGNIIEYNHIHDIGRGILSDMGAVYTLGVSPGTRIRYNVIHDVSTRTYSSQGIHSDEASSSIIIECNIIYRIKGAGIGHHYGQNSVYKNNIIALNDQSQIHRTQPEPMKGNSFSFINNIVYFKQGELLGGNWDPVNAIFDRNLYYNAADREVQFAGLSFMQWQKLGKDENSRISDPLFINPEEGDFNLRDDSPAYIIGYQPWDFLNVGPRKSVLKNANHNVPVEVD